MEADESPLVSLLALRRPQRTPETAQARVWGAPFDAEASGEASGSTFPEGMVCLVSGALAWELLGTVLGHFSA